MKIGDLSVQFQTIVTDKFRIRTTAVLRLIMTEQLLEFQLISSKRSLVKSSEPPQNRF